VADTPVVPTFPDTPGRAPLLADVPATPASTTADITLPTVSRLAAPGPIAPAPSSPAPSSPAPSSAAAPPAVPRRLGLGAPLSRLPERLPAPPEAVVQRSTPTAASPAAGPPGTSAAVTPTATGPADVQSSSVGAAAGPGPAAAPVAEQPAPVVSEPAVEPWASESPAPEPPAPEPSVSELPEVSAAWAPPAPEYATPLLGDRPIATVLPTTEAPAVQRSAVDDAVPIRWAEPDAIDVAAPPSGAGWSQGTGVPGTAVPGTAVPGTAPGLPPQGPPAAGPSSRGPVSGSSVAPAVQRAVAGADAGSVAVRAGVAQRAADGSVVFHPPSDAAPAPVQRLGLPSMPSLPSMPGLPSVPSLPSGMPSMPGLPSGLPSMPGLPSGLPSMPSLPAGLPSMPDLPGLPSASDVSGAVDQARNAASSAEGAVTGAVGNAANAATGAVAGAAGAAAQAVGVPSTDELVRRLFDPLAARLKAELRLDRERAGFVTDLRR
jgi:hypothetical protein